MSSTNRFTKKFEEAEQAFNGKYKRELDALAGLSRVEIDSIVPGTEDLRVYTILMDVVKEASQKNIKQANLAEDIKELGEIAIKIAKKGSLFKGFIVVTSLILIFF